MKTETYTSSWNVLDVVDQKTHVIASLWTRESMFRLAPRILVIAVPEEASFRSPCTSVLTITSIRVGRLQSSAVLAFNASYLVPRLIPNTVEVVLLIVSSQLPRGLQLQRISHPRSSRCKYVP